MNKFYNIIILLSLLIPANPALAVSSLPQEALSTHNELRLKHGSSALEWDNQLASYAEKHAARCQFQHSYGEYGENLAAGYPSATAAIQGWYNEHKHYSYQQGDFSHQTGHFTQLVWKSSTKLGCALVSCNGKNGTPGDFLVCEYNPPGNIIGHAYFQQNVSPLINMHAHRQLT